MMVALAATVAVAALVIAAAGAVIAGQGDRDGGRAVSSASLQTLMWTAGACVRGEGARFDLVSCDNAEAEVLAIAADPPGLGGCPDDTDEVVRVGQARTACVRNYTEPHRGDPGAGGGMLRAGDCVALDGRERPCASPGWYGRALSVVRRTSGCPEGTLDTLTLADHAIACLGGGGRVLAAGMCVARPREEVVARSAIAGIDCGSRGAWAKVTSFEVSGGDCPQGSDRYLKAPGAYRPVTCLSVLND